jgi:hypothetical protein
MSSLILQILRYARKGPLRHISSDILFYCCSTVPVNVCGSGTFAVHGAGFTPVFLIRCHCAIKEKLLIMNAVRASVHRLACYMLTVSENYVGNQGNLNKLMSLITSELLQTLLQPLVEASCIMCKRIGNVL